MYEREEPMGFQGWTFFILESGCHHVKIPYISIVEGPVAEVGTTAVASKIMLQG
jgi:hypothetical protein